MPYHSTWHHSSPCLSLSLSSSSPPKPHACWTEIWPHLTSLYPLSSLTLHTTITCVCACIWHHVCKRDMGEKKWPDGLCSHTTLASIQTKCSQNWSMHACTPLPSYSFPPVSPLSA
jgi:hypothetical protein